MLIRSAEERSEVANFEGVCVVGHGLFGSDRGIFEFYKNESPLAFLDTSLTIR